MYFFLPKQVAKIIAVVIALTSNACAASAKCDESKGLSLFHEQNYAEAFEVLRVCEQEVESSADALVALAYLYLDTEPSGVANARERAVKIWTLSERAALTGNVDAVTNLASMYEVGDSETELEPNISVSDCLLRVTDEEEHLDSEGHVLRESIESCLALLSVDERKKLEEPTFRN